MWDCVIEDMCAGRIGAVDTTCYKLMSGGFCK